MARCGCDPKCTCIVQVSDGACLDLNISGSGNTGDPIIITGEVLVDNDTVVCTGTGLATSINTVDTDTVDLSGDGSGATPLRADAILTPDNTGQLAGTPGFPTPGANLLHNLGPGLYVSCEDVQDCVGAAVQVAAGDCLTYDDNANTLNVQIDTTQPNGVECNPGAGLLVTPSSDANNALVFGSDGRLYTPASTPFIINDTGLPCLDLNVTGTGQPGDPQVLSGAIVIDPNACNALVCGGAGLIVPQVDIVAQLIQPGPAPGIGSPCLAVQETAACPNTFVVTMALSDDPCQAIECRADGLWAPLPRGESCINNQCFPTPGPINQGQSRVFTTNNIQICNSGCCPVRGRIQMDWAGLQARVRNGSIITQGLRFEVNGGGFQNMFPFNERTIDTFQQTGNANSTKLFDLAETESTVITVQPGQCITFRSEYTVAAVFGSIASFAVNGGGAGWCVEFMYNLAPVCDCNCSGQAPSC